ncbi:MAG: lytic transglycosylase domain-containing protein [Bdellovibrionales bacterium]|nr:lytic transglycosylase domain-containing protein [Bdellovibrionales bacterium]
MLNLLLAFIGLSTFTCFAAEPLPPLDLTVHPRLKPHVEFWTAVYTRYTVREGLIHDAKYVDKIYEVISDPKFSKLKKKKWKSVLLSLHEKQKKGNGIVDIGSLTDDEKKVFQLYLDVPDADKFLDAAHRKRLRFQLGQKDSFISGLRMSGQYLKAMEEVFKREGVPQELTRLPFVESSFNVKARSKVGASGVWQFMPSTGRLFLRIDSAVDERNDPMRATEAAAKLLRMNYESLGTWPLAVTAYNHGRKGLMKAVRRVGSNQLSDLLDSYRGRNFGFASSNYYASLIAAIQIERNADRYFGEVRRDEPVQFVEAQAPKAINLPGVSKLLSLDFPKLEILNPGLQEEVFTGLVLLPQGYKIRLPVPVQPGGLANPESAVRVFLSAFESIPPLYERPSRKFAYRSRGGSGKGRRSER